ncbi:MAG TPA: chemotaxis protein CheW [Ruminococcaceae bacterium]|jgi:purine-binding chemotaxis protein CheW|nr:chemotaxis protein CheW [Oscillospiraceae bacterium]HBG54997.1 chemotaxis protein CheW [Oscillospiraceae bacterium]HBQ46515.1 chemotaxis protein CheW [Oscillospiraceae bacterium]HBT90430.1 chemotaxis protein CheW [Oscillospiraceae bacterium]HCB90551.1 chemotaxis protein CheW [Oscillospiraceae bacterium]
MEKILSKGLDVADGTEEDEDEDSAEAEQKFLTFWTDGELFGIPISDVVQIISMQDITPLPDFPDYAKGVINLRGNIIPVIDMRLRLKKPEAEYTENTCIVVTSVEDSYIGFIVDTVDEVTDIGADHITPAPKVSRNVTNRYLTGIGRIGEKVVLLLDVSKILSDEEFSQVTQPADEAGKDDVPQDAAGEGQAQSPAPADSPAPDKKE